jgi:hypothetical protein
MLFSRIERRIDLYGFADVSEEHTSPHSKYESEGRDSTFVQNVGKYLQTTRRQILKGSNRHNHRRENHQSQTVNMLSNLATYQS